MEEKELKTSPKQRIFIAAIAIIMVGSIVAGYAAIVLGNSGAGTTAQQEIDPEKLQQYQDEYEQATAEFATATQADFEKFVAYKGEVKAYNEATANENGVQTVDLVVGEGRELAEDENDYLAYYIGWCADESVFDTTLDSTSNPTKFANVLDVSTAGTGLIEGWEMGVTGMKLGGIREITMPGEVAYKDTREVCGGNYKPLKFLVMVVENEEPLKTAKANLDLAATKLQYAQYGIDYDAALQEIEAAQDTEEE